MTATRITSSERRRPIAVSGGGFSQSPAYGASTAFNLALSAGVSQLVCRSSQALHAIGVSHARGMCQIPLIGSSLCVRDFHDARENDTIESSVSCNDSGRMAFWIYSLAAAEVRKAKGDSMHAFLTPSPPI